VIRPGANRVLEEEERRGRPRLTNGRRHRLRLRADCDQDDLTRRSPESAALVARGSPVRIDRCQPRVLTAPFGLFEVAESFRPDRYGASGGHFSFLWRGVIQ
jgi:hypothetical protein